MEKARLFFIDNNVHISTALSFASMPACYVVPHVAKLLSATHSLKYPSKRMAETGQFTVYLMRPDAFEAGSRFIPAAQKVRLLHASIRHHLAPRGPLGHRAARDADLPGGHDRRADVLLACSSWTACTASASTCATEGAEAYYYAWRVVGAMLGVDQDAVPQDPRRAPAAFLDLYMVRHMGPSEEGAHLTRQLIDLYEEVVPGTFFDPIVSALIRHLIGDTCADWLEVPRTPWDTVVKAGPGAPRRPGDHRGPLPARRLGAGPPRPPHHRVRAVLPDPRPRHALRHPRAAEEGVRGPTRSAGPPWTPPAPSVPS